MFTERRGLRSLRTSPEQLDKPEFEDVSADRFSDFVKATCKNFFLMVWVRDFDPNSVLKTPEYFVYFGVFKRKSRGKRSTQTAKGEFLELPPQIFQCSICLFRILPAIHLTENTRLFCPQTVCPTRTVLSGSGKFFYLSRCTLTWG